MLSYTQNLNLDVCVYIRQGKSGLLGERDQGKVLGVETDQLSLQTDGCAYFNTAAGSETQALAVPRRQGLELRAQLALNGFSS